MLDFTLVNNTYILTAAEITLLQTHPPARKKDWNKNRYGVYKQNIKANLIVNQFDRCAYCRKILEADGKYEPLDHIVPQSIQPTWIFKVRNLILTCESCNNLKKMEQTLAQAYVNNQDLPNLSSGYIIFNPHFDRWSHHLNYEDDLFIVAVPDSKGEETIRICQLYRYNVILNRAKELKIGQQTPAMRAMQRLRTLDKNSHAYIQLRNELYEAIDHFLQRMADNPNFN